jgi:DNA-binding LacI/PurR family transcriptional regulator
MLLMVAGDQEQRARVVRYARGGYVDGLLLVSTHSGDEILDEFERAQLPTICCGRPLGHEHSIPYVAADDRGGARLMCRHLVSSGRQRIATITGPLDTPGGAGRLAGYHDVLGATATADLVATSPDWSYAGGEKAMTELLERVPDLDAVFVASDLMASGALAVLRRRGRAVPEEIVVGGFDDSPVAVTTEPSLTTIRQPLALVGREMVHQLLRLLDGEVVGSVILPTELVVRRSA